MFKLVLATGAALFAVLTIYGHGGEKMTGAAEAAAVTAPAEHAADVPVITDVPQIAPKLPKFAGPELRPSPEHAGKTPPVAVARADSGTLYVAADTVNMRSGPTRSDAVIAPLDRGDEVTLLGATDGEWVNVRDDRGRAGYVAARYLSPQKL